MNQLRVKLFLSTLFTLFIILYSLLISPTLAQISEDQDKRLKEIQEQISKLEAHLNDARSEEKNLKAQLQIIDTQTELTELRIEQTTAQIAKLTREITDLSGRIERLSGTLDSVSNLLLHRIVETYKYGSISSVDLFFSSKGFSDLLTRAKYLQVAQANDKKILYQLQATKIAYNEQKTDKEERQKQQEKLSKDLVVYKVQLESQKLAKGALLAATQNDETRFQSLIAGLRAEQESIAKAISNISRTIGEVSKGQVIAAMGSTGCSTGPHLHFEVFENAKVEGGRIVGNRTNPHNFLDSGRLGAPVSGYPGETIITTEYGEVYFLGTHTGLDIAPSHFEGVGRSILASEGGTAYGTSAPCSYRIAGGSTVGNGIIIDHHNGLVTLYWHTL